MEIDSNTFEEGEREQDSGFQPQDFISSQRREVQEPTPVDLYKFGDFSLTPGNETHMDNTGLVVLPRKHIKGMMRMAPLHNVLFGQSYTPVVKNAL